MTGSFGEPGFGCVEFLPPGFEQIPVKAQAFAWSGLARTRDCAVKRVLSERPGCESGNYGFTFMLGFPFICGNLRTPFFNGTIATKTSLELRPTLFYGATRKKI
jgi:hypothetical protein